MTYQEKIGHLKSELRMLLDDKKKECQISNSMYRFGTDQSLQNLTYGDIKESLEKILNYDKSAKLAPMHPMPSINS